MLTKTCFTCFYIYLYTYMNYVSYAKKSYKKQVVALNSSLVAIYTYILE